MYYSIVDHRVNIPISLSNKYVLTSPTYRTTEFSYGDPIIFVPVNSLYAPTSISFNWSSGNLEITDMINQHVHLECVRTSGELRITNIDANDIIKCGGVEVSAITRIGSTMKVNVSSTIPLIVYSVDTANGGYVLTVPTEGLNERGEHYCNLPLYPQVGVING